jgi:hypothetical protein
MKIRPTMRSVDMRKVTAWMCLAVSSAQALGATPEEAARLFEARQWAEAAAAYESIVDREPGNGLALIRLARSRAANGEDVAALEALNAWFATGSASFQAAMTVPEFESLRADPRFVAIVEPHRPCSTPEFRQFDFWLGDWDVETVAAPGTVSRNQITRAYDGCTVREEYTTPYGYAGTSLNFYDATRKVWHQTWIDNQGGGLFLEGGLRGRDMVLSTPADRAEIQRITWTPLDGGRVRQHWESSSDGGKTWVTAFDGLYTRRTTAAASTP